MVTDTSKDATTCLIAGGGPAGMMLGLLLARGGIDVTVMEKQADFLRDFRGDTVHPSTLRMLDELGLGDEFAAIPHRMIESISGSVQGAPLQLDLHSLPGDHQHIALVPQWDFLELLARAAAREPSFTLLRNAEVLAPIRRGGCVTGVRYRDADGVEREMSATLTVACDGRSSTLRTAAGLVPRSFGAPMDVWWFRVPREPADPPGLNGVFADGHGVAIIDGGDYYQIAYLIKKGSDAHVRIEGIEALRNNVATLVPWLRANVQQLHSFDDVRLLDVQLNRLRKWYTCGLLLIGDAAHAMSPVGGVGINLAVADAVAAARILAGPVAGRHAVRTGPGPRPGAALGAHGAGPAGAAADARRGARTRGFRYRDRPAQRGTRGRPVTGAAQDRRLRCGNRPTGRTPPATPVGKSRRILRSRQMMGG